MKKLINFFVIVVFIFVSGSVFAETETSQMSPAEIERQIHIRASQLAQKMGVQYIPRKTNLILVGEIPVKIGNRDVTRDMFAKEELEKLDKIGWKIPTW